MFMASVGAASETFDEMINTIHLNKSTHSLEAYKNLLENLTINDDVLKIATGMFIDTTFNIKPSFVENSLKYLKSPMEKLNFKVDPETQRQFLNDWVSSKTNNKIKDLFAEGSINEGTDLILANAVHFKSAWINKFTNTEEDAFYLNPNYKTIVKMMFLKHDFKYYHNKSLKFAALELPYKHSFKMVILLPDEKDGLKNLENNLSKIKLMDILNKMTTYYVSVKLPRFKLEQTFDLKNTLSNLGCPKMFSRDANFSNIVDDTELYVSKVVHKAYVEVDEEGTEAAAATGMIMSLMSGRIPNVKRIISFEADHPFIVTIITPTNQILFLGRLSKPKSIL
ncbi:Hypothetical protein CINCED_3A010295 [Cinara cedri]|nr:Hypothetical protein CINCED_3A010295 [Cinara cedri]